MDAHYDRSFVLGDADLAVLRCPKTNADLRWVNQSELQALHRHTGVDFDDGLVTSDERFLYPIAGGIVYLLASEAVPLADSGRSQEALDVVKAGLRRFYDEVGWTRSENSFTDARMFEDLRPVADEYVRRSRERVGDQLADSGRYFLDVASGPVQFEEYVQYSERYEKRLCVDLSVVALKAAKNKLGKRALCILGDITNLPLKDGVMDAAISLHTIYHVPADQQATAFREVQRVLAPGKPGVVVYSWGNRLYWKLLHAPVSARQRWQSLRNKLKRKRANPNEASLENGFYFSPFSRKWFEKQDWSFPTQIRVWRAASIPSMQTYAHERLGGRRLLRAVFALEERWPALMGRIGQYPMIVIWGTAPSLRTPAQTKRASAQAQTTSSIS